MFQLIIIGTLIATVFGGVIPNGLVPVLDGRIVGGQDTTIENFPHQISMKLGGAHRCGGTIFRVDIIISAAHCTVGVNPTALSIVAGTTSKTTGGISIPVKYLVEHEQYNIGVQTNYDIVILFLEKGFTFSNSIQSIALATTNDITRTGTRTIVTGWGALIEGGGSPNILQYVSVPVVSNEDCAKVYGSNRITSVMMCAGESNGGKDSCQGDSGGPMIVGNKLVGIVSWGAGCARRGYPGVYSNVATLRPWIDNTIKNYN